MQHGDGFDWLDDINQRSAARDNRRASDPGDRTFANIKLLLILWVVVGLPLTIVIVALSR